jgi:hypothetical protein
MNTSGRFGPLNEGLLNQLFRFARSRKIRINFFIVGMMAWQRIDPIQTLQPTIAGASSRTIFIIYKHCGGDFNFSQVRSSRSYLRNFGDKLNRRRKSLRWFSEQICIAGSAHHFPQVAHPSL